MTPAVPLFFAAAAGAMLGSHGAFGLTIPVVVCGVFLAAALAARGEGAVRFLRFAALVGLAAALATTVATFERRTYTQTIAALPLSSGPLVVEGVARDVAPSRSGGQVMTLDATGYLKEGTATAAGARVKVRLKGGAAAAAVKAGDKVRVRGVLRPLFPAFSPGTFDAALFGLSRQTHARLSVFDRQAIAVVERGAEMAVFARWRNHLRETLNGLVTPREAGVLLALIVGDTAQFDRAQLDLYRSVGAGHLLAVSGLQVSLLAFFVFAVVRLLLAAFPWTGRRGWARPLATLASLVSVCGFVLLCGAPPSCVRAGVMAAAVLVAALFGRRARALDALGLGGLCTVLLAPTSVIDPSFLLSYAAVLGLIAVGAPADAKEDANATSDSDADEELARAKRKVRLRQALAVVASAFAAGVVTLPTSAHLFGELSLGGIVANVVLVPVASALQVPAIGLGLLGALVGSPLIAELGAASAGLLEAITEGLSLLVGGVIAVPSPTGLQAAGLTGAAVLLAVYFGRPRQLQWFGAATLVAIGVLVPSTFSPDGLRITVLPVGQGDGAVVEMEDGRVLVIDGGGVWDERVNPGEKVVVPFLRRRGISKIHAVVLSHPDPDHLLGLLDVLRSVPVAELWHSGFTQEHPLMKRLLELADEKHVRVRTARDLAPVESFGATTVEILTPFPEDGSALYEELSPNENSLTLRFVHGNDSALWPGDLEEWGERYLLRDGHTIASSVIKAGHHGSKTSSTPPFVAAVAPKVVIFPTGPDNQWGFPHAEVVHRWAQTGAQLFDTAKHGEITLFLTGQGVEVHPFRNPREGTLKAQE